MADEKTKQDGRDRSRVAEGEGCEVEYSASKHGLSEHQARTMIQTVGNDREKLNTAAEKVVGMRGKDAG